MNQRHLSPRIALICLVTLLGGSTVVHGQLLPLTSTGSLGAWSFPAGYTYKLNTDNLTIDRCAGPVCSWETWNGSTWVPASSGVPVARVVTQTGGPEIAVFDFTTLNLPAGVTLTVEGARAGAIAATGDVTIAGTLVVTATGGAGGIAPSPVDGTGGVPAQGPGAGGPGQGPGRMILSNTPSYGLWPLYGPGGGGSGAAGNGLPGSESNRILDVDGATWQLAGGAAGSAYITGGSLPLRGGSGGGSGGGFRDPDTNTYIRGGTGGNGGGALLVDTAGSLAISGNVTADGSVGTPQDYGWGGGGGGGGGGYLAFQVDGILVVEGGGRVSAEGGVGGSGTCQAEPSYG